MPAGESRCIDCLRPLKPYELDEAGRCAICDRLFRPTGRPPAPFPTQHLPGSIGKLIVLEWRAEREFGLWHADDAIEDERPNGESHYHWLLGEREPRIVRALMRSA